jgi:hypothetical protein
MAKNQSNFEAGEQLIKRLKESGFDVVSNEVRKKEPKYDYDVKINNKKVITILPRSKCLFKYIGKLSSGKLVTAHKKQDVEKLFNTLLQLKGE